MSVSAVEITRRELYADGQAFGDTGPYERLGGVLTLAVDPEHVANRSIVDLALAPRDAQGLVRFQADFSLLIPQNPSRGNRRLIVDVVNRGRIRVVPLFNRAVVVEGSADIPPGDGFVFRHGYSVASIGWQWDVYRSEALLGLQPPYAQVPGPSGPGQAIVEMRPNVVESTRLLADRVHQPYQVADLDEPEAMLLVRDWQDGPATVLPRQQWRFAQATAEGVVPSHEHVYLSTGFQPGKIYHVIYTPRAVPVVGAGLLAVRDVAVWLRHAGALNPVAGGFERLYACGVSQTGRMLRHFLFLGLNTDEQGRLVYDGLMPHVAGGRRGEFNHRFAQPSQQHTPGFGHLFPFADHPLTDPFSGHTDGLLSRLRAAGTAPKIFYTNSSAEYWRGDASLLHVEPSGKSDLEGTPESRIYLFASTQHVAGVVPQASGPGPDGSFGRYPYNVVDYRPLLRAALLNLDRWVSDGVEPPPSRHPRLEDGTAVSRHEVVAAFKALPGIEPPDPERLWIMREIDLGPQAAQGVARHPAPVGRAYAGYASAVDADGNELAGIRLPDIAVPVGTHTGWNPRAPETGAPEQVIAMLGFSHFFAPTLAARQAMGDPRPSLAERYASREAYLEQVRVVVQQLVQEHYLLAEDQELVVDTCAARYDFALGKKG
ncbi:MAG: alpha/beta hydrolase domain-containing protein [Candidatus Tectimicrobiota bacterium]